MAKIIYSNGKQVEVQPANGSDFQLEELQGFVKGYVRPFYMANERLMCVNEDGISLGLPLNEEATRIITNETGTLYPIFGDVLICDYDQIK